MELSLIEVQGLIANCCIENEEHRVPLERCGRLIEKFGPFRKVDWEDVIDVLYRTFQRKV